MRYAPVPFVVGAARSGTTLLRLMLDSHPELTIPPETHFVPDLIDAASKQGTSPERLAEVVVAHRRWGDFHLDADELRDRFRSLERPTSGAAVRAFYALYAERQAKPRWGDKTPPYVKHMLKIEKALPETRFIHVIRDGHDVALSALSQSFGSDSVVQAAERWKDRIERGRLQAKRLNHYLEVRYEDLVLDSEPTLHAVCEFCQLTWNPEMLAYYERAEERLREHTCDLPAKGTRPIRSADERVAAHALAWQPPDPNAVGRWRTKMTEADRAAFEEVAGELLAGLGYEVGKVGGDGATGRG